MNHSPVIIEDDLDAQIRKAQRHLENLQLQKPKPVIENDLSHVWRYFTKNESKKISRARFNIFFEGSYHAIGKMTKAQFKKKLLNHFDVISDTNHIYGLELLDGYIYKPPADGKFLRWKFKSGIFVHEKDVYDACQKYINIYYDESQPMTQ